VRSAVFLVPTLVLAAATSACAAPAPQADADDLVRRYFDAANDAARKDVLAEIGRRDDVAIGQLADAVRRGVFYKPERTGLFTMKITVAFDGSETDCRAWVPEDYDPSKPYPTLIAMHGTGGTGERFIRRWLPHCRQRGMILIAPTARSGVDKLSGKPFGRGHGYGTQELERSVPISALNAVRRRYHVDSDRVIIAGVSMGGHCTWDSVLTRSDHFSGGIVEAGVPIVEGYTFARGVVLPNLAQVRMWVMQGTPDRDQPEINTEATQRLAAMGYPVVYRQYQGKGHNVYPAESDEALDWVLKGARDNYAPRVTKIVHRLIHGRAYWVRIDAIRGKEWDPRVRVNVKADADTPRARLLELVEEKVSKEFMHLRADVLRGNDISIRTKSARKLTVFLHDKLVDMDKPVRISVNGHTRFRRKLKRDPAFMLEHVREDYDTGRIYYAAVSVSGY
jgi:predicted esterase